MKKKIPNFTIDTQISCISQVQIAQTYEFYFYYEIQIKT